MPSIFTQLLFQIVWLVDDNYLELSKYGPNKVTISFDVITSLAYFSLEKAVYHLDDKESTSLLTVNIIRIGHVDADGSVGKWIECFLQ